MGSILSGTRVTELITGVKRLERHGASNDDWNALLGDDHLARRMALTLQRRGSLYPTPAHRLTAAFGDPNYDTSLWARPFDKVGKPDPGAHQVSVDESDLFLPDPADSQHRPIVEMYRPMYIGRFPDGQPVTIARCLEKAGWTIQTWWPDSPWSQIVKRRYAHTEIKSGWYLVRQYPGPATAKNFSTPDGRMVFRPARTVEYFCFAYLVRYMCVPTTPFDVACHDEFPGPTSFDRSIYRNRVRLVSGGQRMEMEVTHHAPSNLGFGLVAYLG